MIRVKFKAKSLTRVIGGGQTRYRLLAACQEQDRSCLMFDAGSMNEFVIMMPESVMVMMKMLHSEFYTITVDG